MRRILPFAGWALCCAVWAGEPVRPLVINGDAATLAFQPSFATHPDGAVTYVWNAYHESRERIFTITLADGRLTRRRQLSPGAGVYYQPLVVSTGARSGWAFWMKQSAERWQIVGRRMRDGEWGTVVVLTGESETAMAPAAATHGSEVVLAWEEHFGKRQQIKTRTWNGREWGPAEAVSQPDLASYRPALAVAAGGAIWAFWDSYNGREYAVCARQIAPVKGGVTRLSPPGRDCLKAVAVPGPGSGIAAAWLAVTELIGGAGVLDHWDTVQVATNSVGNWEVSTDAGGGTGIADLRHGLLPQIEPIPSTMWGYAGRRRHPMLAADGTAIWLLWERKAVHDGRSDTIGQLCGRRLEAGRWSDPLLLHEGLVDYRIPSDGAVHAGKLGLVAKDIHHFYSTFSLDLDQGRKIAFDSWPGWQPVALPLRPEAARPSVEIEGRRYYLYWGDLHVHTELTPDAEGEVDETMHFARNKARLDVVVMQENDSNSWMNRNPQGAFRNLLLSQAEYELSVYFSRRYTENGRFVAMPGFEWSQRTDDDKSNHRTVIYPGRDTPLIRHPENGNDFNELCEVVEAAGGVMFAQHAEYRLVGCPVDTNVEVATGWGIYIIPPDKIHADLSAGHRIGFVATSDGHRRNPGTGGGLTGIYAPELTPAAIADALRQRRVFATNGSRVSIEARANGVFMGQDLTATGSVELTLRADAPRPIVRAVLVRDGAEINTVVAAGKPSLETRFRDEPPPGFHWYYWRIELEGRPPQYPGNMKVAEGHLAWSSPHRVQVPRR